jgi:hypothetical protein
MAETPDRYARPGTTLTTSQIISNIQNEQQRVRNEKNINAEKAKQQKALQEAVREFDVLTTARKARYVELAGLETTLRNFYVAYGPPPYDAGEQSNLNNAITNINAMKSAIATLTSRINTAETLKKSIQNQLISASAADAKRVLDKTKPVVNKGKGKGSTQIKPAGTETAPPLKNPPLPPYTYNAPMVQSAYFRDNAPQGSTASSSVSGPGNYPDARNAFGIASETAKGTIQMSRKFQDSTQFYNKKEISNQDLTMYGFKFLYNPNEVSMGWGIAEGFNPEVIQSGADGGFGTIGAGLFQSTVDFTLLLNRIGDMSYLDSNGLISPSINPYPNNFNTAEDLQMIYKKGTMYDLEYLFRTLNGPSAIYDSGLNGKTADRGYLTGAMVELHLGDGLRYQVRVGNISINHTLFNDRMVPLVSNVQLSCHRYVDIPVEGDR